MLGPPGILTCGSAFAIELGTLGGEAPYFLHPAQAHIGYMEELPHLRGEETLNNRYYHQHNHFIDGKMEVLGR